MRVAVERRPTGAVEQRLGRQVLGHPFNSLSWIANHLGARGGGLRAGDLVMSGSISSLLRPGAGDTVSARLTRLGGVSARFV